jgi:hypothetical protein
MEDGEHLDIPQLQDFNPADTNSSKMEVNRGMLPKGTRMAAAKELKCLCTKFWKYCRWNFNLA